MRISGPAAQTVAKLLRPAQLPPPRQAQLRAVLAPDGRVIDRALLLFFPAPHSFTGEDVVELHVHGGRAIIQAVTTLLHDVCGFRLAEPGEFTRRGFEHGRFDLTGAEAINDLVNAETEAQRLQAFQQMEGSLTRLYDGWHTRLKQILAHLEAAIDFVDEEDVPATLLAAKRAEIAALAAAMTEHLNDKRRGELLREGIQIAILGAPNAGKSSLLNVLAERDVAIVSATAGTTRDIIEVRLDLGGYPVVVADTAGLRDSADMIEAEGVRRALSRAEQAAIKILLYDGTVWPRRDLATQALEDENSLVVINKSDLMAQTIDNHQPVSISVKTGDGIPSLLAKLTAMVSARLADQGQPSLTRERHRFALQDCLALLQAAQQPKAPELCIEDLRLAMRALGRITGRVDVEDLLDVIFRDFCIGK